VTFETNRSPALAGTRASQQLQHNRVLAMCRLAKLSDTSQIALPSNLAYGRGTLSFLTLSKSRQARLFFGVNEDGLVGLHYRAVSGNNDAHDPGRDRTPYFSDSPTAAEADPGTE